MPKVTYNNKKAIFFPALKKEIDTYFAEQHLPKTGTWRLFSKTIILLSASVILYCLAMFISLPAILSIIICGLLGFTLALVGFNVMHDACHGSYSTNKNVNEILGYTLNLIGGNSFLWKQKHNILHHTYTNVDGKDDDIAKSPFIRMCSTQKWVAAHRLQHIYLPFLYAISSLFWILWQDFYKYFTKRVYTSKLPTMSKKEHIVFWVSKVVYLVVYIILPIAFHGWLAWLVGFLTLNVVMGLTTSIVFQLAHVVEETEFVYVGIDDSIVIENEWAVHQIKTTANFSPGSKVITYLSGGLNYQVEHHLFPRISHVHYPSISKIVKKKCEEYNLPYLSMPTFAKALSSHFRLIRRLGLRA